MGLTAFFLEVLKSDAGVLVVLGTMVVAIVVARSVASVLQTQARERSRREIAAYIAEGSMTPEQGEKLMKSGGREQA